MCATRRGTWLVCPPPSAQLRVTVGGQACRVPFLYQGLVRSDCVLQHDGYTQVRASRPCPGSGGRMLWPGLVPEESSSLLILAALPRR